MKKFVLCLSLLLATTFSVYADGIENITISNDIETNKVKCSFTVGSAEGTSVNVAVRVYDPDGIDNYMDIFYTDAEGKGSFEYINNGESGMYTFNFYSGGQSETVEYKFLNATYWNAKAQEFAGLLEVLKADLENTFKLEAVKTFIDTNKDDLELSFDLYNTLEDFDGVYKSMAVSYTQASDYTTKESITDAFYGNTALCHIKENSTTEAVRGVIDNAIYADALKLSSLIPNTKDGNKLLDSVNPNIKTAVCLQIAAGATDYIKVSELKSAFSIYGLVKSIYNAEYYTDVKTALDAYSTAGLIRLKANSLSDKTQVYNYLKGKPYTSVSAVANAYNTYIDENSGVAGSGGGRDGSSRDESDETFVPTVNGENILAIPQNEVFEQQLFSDLDEVKWAYNEIKDAAEAGIVNGDGSGKFMPYNQITRAEAVTMIVRLLNLDTMSNSMSFNDVKPSDWYYPYVSKAYAANVFNGISNNMFGANNKITREEMAAALWRILEQKGMKVGDITENFADEADISSWAKDAVYGLWLRGVVNGKTSSEFYPKDTLTRVEATVMVSRIIKYVR